jgi:hypothetical protein
LEIRRWAIQHVLEEKLSVDIKAGEASYPDFSRSCWAGVDVEPVDEE